MKSRKGFTLIELVVVIAVLGILTLVMIPIIANAINNARIENDKVLVDNMNNILEADEPYNGKPGSGDEVLWIFTGNGLDIDDTNYSKHAFYWVIDDNKVIIYDTEKESIIYPAEFREDNINSEKVTDNINANEWYLIAGESNYKELAYKITYYVNGKKIKFHGKTSYDGTVDVELPVPTLYADGYQFSGWHTDKGLESEVVTIIEQGDSGDKTFYSTFIKITPEIPDDDYCKTNPDAEECKDYCLNNPNAESCKDPSKTKYSITYHTNGGTLKNPQTSYDGPLEEEISLPRPERYGYHFVGWFDNVSYSGLSISKIEKDSTGNKVFYALWEKDPESVKVYNITYVLNGGVLPEDAPTKYEGPLVKAITLPTPARNGYTFGGWYTTSDFTGNTYTEVGSNEYGDKTFYAKWNLEENRQSDTYYVTYVLNGGILYNPPYELKGEQDFYLLTPLKRGYEFMGWYLVENPTESDTSIAVIKKEEQTKDYTLYAIWQPVIYSIKYNLNGGSWINSYTVNYTYTIEQAVKYTQEVQREGYGFGGWYDNPECNGSPILETQIGDTGDKTLYAKWDADIYNIHYIVYKTVDTTGWPKTFKENQSVTLPIPVAEGYEFLGWYDNEEFEGNPITIIPENTTRSIILYAKWETIKYNINYVYSHNEETIIFNNPIDKYTVEDTIDFTDILPSTTYYTFEGWFTESDFSGEEFKIIEEGTTGDITLYAKWEGIPLVIPAEFNGGTLQNRTITQFAEELVNDFNNAGRAYTGDTTTIENFKKTSYRNINYVWGNGNTEMIEKYQWFFEFAQKEVIAAGDAALNVYGTLYYESNDTKYILDSTKAMFSQLINGNSHAVDPYNYHANGWCSDCQKTHSGEVYGVLGDTTGHNKTLFRAWIDGLINSTFYYSADIYRGCMLDFSEEDNMQKFNKAYTGKELEVVTKDALPIPIQKGFRFDGWYDNASFAGTNYTTTTQIYDLFSQWEKEDDGQTKINNFKLYAKWTAINKYTVNFVMNGGHWEGRTLEDFSNELVYFFKMSHQQYDSHPNTTVEDFYNTSRPNIHTVWYDATLWHKYKWLFDFAKTEIINAAKVNSISIPNTTEFLNKITTNKDSAINEFKKGDESYNYHKNYKPLDILCEWLHCLMNKSAPLTRNWLPDYSKQENLDRFHKAYYATETTKTYYEGDTLPTPIRDGFVFLGWYNNAGYKVDKVNASYSKEEPLRALWQKNVKNDAELAEAIGYVNNGTVSSIYLEPGTYSGNYTIAADWISIYGPNYNVNPNTSTRKAEAIFTGSITLDSTVNGFALDGLAFTGNAKIKATKVTDFTFRNNYVYDITESKEWVDTEKYNSGFITIILPTGDTDDDTLSSNLTKNLDFRYNKFKNVQDVNIYITNSKNVNITENVFEDFGSNAIRFGDSFTDGKVNIEYNKFIQSTTVNTSTNGIFFRMYGQVKGSTDCIINIQHNEFVNIGYNTTSSLYKGAISAKNYKEYGANFIITNNYFENCYNYIRIRNNCRTVANHTTYSWLCTIENNQFIGLPKEYYFASRNGSDSDTDSSTPNKTVFGANYYEDNNSNVITDLSSYAQYFKDTYSYGTALTEKPTN